MHLTMRTWKAEKIPVKSLAGILSNLTGRRLIPGKEGAQLIGADYTTVVFREGPSYYTMSGIARIGKGCSNISGDSFTMMDLPGGKRELHCQMAWDVGRLPVRKAHL